ncbi:MAG TPA: S41 family peptidase [Candidatus Limnocylindrales bacterium]|nr:S41 family peptidase [Candidatus Limnocylindrales bacterium]
MERGIKGMLRKWVVVFILVIISTNLINYYIFNHTALNFAPKPPLEAMGDETKPRAAGEELSIIQETLDVITKNYFHPVDTDVLIEGAVRGMIMNLDDPQVRFYNPDELQEFLLDARGIFGGIGVRIIEIDQSIVIFEIMPGTPAEASGLSPGDRIRRADGYDLTGQGVNRAVELLRGPPDSNVTITIERPGSDELIELTVVRAEIRVITVSSEMLEDGFGYIQISSFDSSTANEFTEQLTSLEHNGLEAGLILDLRNNRGGLVDQAVEVAKLLVPEGEIVRLVGRNEEVRQVYYSSAVKKPYPIVVLINEESASASELLAGALQDRGAAVLVGKNTYGKASVQHLESLSDGSAIMLTVARYLTPSGHDIDEHGIMPDFEVEAPEALRYYRYFLPGSLERGAYGADVELLQRILVQLGHDVEVDGIFGENTVVALSDFQAASGIVQSGVFDDQTWFALREALEIASRELDEQLKFALDLIRGSEVRTIVGGSNR